MIVSGLMSVLRPEWLAAVRLDVLPQPFAGLADGALRALLVAGLVSGGLRLLKTHNVVAQKAAWVLVLAGAMVLPLSTPWAGQVRWLTLAVPTDRWLGISEPGSFARVTQTLPVVKKYNDAPARSHEMSEGRAAHREAVGVESQSGGSRFPAPVITQNPYAGAAPTATPPVDRDQGMSLGAWALALYGLVCFALLVRLGFGLCAAALLWLRAEQVPEAALPESADGLRVRSSEAILSPVTIGSGIVLPADYAAWDVAKLRMVLAHERSHVRQRDFYLQLCAGLYTAVNWPSPLGWWLKRKLSDLSETISDRAALLESTSHANYAQILLEFAATPRTNLSRTHLGVAMARPRRLADRIERLLNESSYRQAFAGSRMRLLMTILLVPTLLATAALVRVQAAGQEAQPPAPPAPVAAPPTPSSTPSEQEPAAQQPAPPAAPTAPAAAPATPPAPPQTIQIITPRMPNPPKVLFLQDSAGAGAGFGSGSSSGSGPSGSKIITLDRSENNPDVLFLSDAQNAAHIIDDSSSHSYENDGQFYGVFQKFGDNVHFSGKWTKGHMDAIEKASEAATGDFILYTGKDGKSYYIDDPQEVNEAKALYLAADAMGFQQMNLSKEQEAVTKALKQFSEHRNEPVFPKPDMQKELAGLNAEIAKLQAVDGNKISEQQLSELQAKLGEMQGKIAQLQFSLNGQSMNWSKMSDELAKQQKQWVDELNSVEVKRKLQEQETENKIQSIVKKSIENGKAKPLQ